MAFGMGGDNKLEVVIDGDASGLDTALGNATSSVNDFKKKAAGLGAAMSGAAAGGIAASVKAASDFEDQMREVQKVTDAETAEALDEEIRQLSKDIPIATNELAKITEQAGRFGIEGEKNITAFTESVAKMASATTLSTDQAGEAFAKLSTLTNTPISEIENLGSSINELSNNFATSSDEIVQNMMESAGALSQMGASQTEIAGLSAAMNEMFKSSSKAGRSLRRLSQEMMDPKKVEGLASAMGMTTEEFKQMRSEDPAGLMLKMAETMEQGGKQADQLRGQLSSFSRQALTKLAQNSDQARKAMQQSGKAYEENTSLQREFELQTESLSSQLQLLKNALRDVGITVGRVFLPYVKQAVQVIQDAVAEFQSWNQRSQGVVAAIGLVGTAIAGLIPAIGLMATSASAAAPAITGMATALSGLAAPALALMGIVAGLAQAWRTNFAGIRDQTLRVAGVIKTQFAPTLRLLRTLGQEILSSLSRVWERHGDTVEAAVNSQIVAAADLLIRGIRRLASVTNSALRSAIQWWRAHGDETAMQAARFTGRVVDVIAKGLRTIGRVTRSVLQSARSLWTRHGETVSRIATGAYATLKTIVRQALTGLRTATTTVLATVQGQWQRHGATLKRIVTTAYRTAQSVISSVGQTLQTTVGAALRRATALWRQHGTAVKTVVATAITAVVSTYVTRIRSLRGVVTSVLSAVTSRWRSSGSAVRTVATGVRTALSSLGNSFRTLIGPVTTIASLFGGRLVTVLKRARGAVTGGITVLRTLGTVLVGLNPVLAGVAAAVAAFAVAYKTNFMGVRDITQQVIQRVTTILQQFGTRAEQIIQQATTRIQTLWETTLRPLVQQTAQIFQQIGQAIMDAMQWIYQNAIQPLLQEIKRVWAVHGDEIFQEAKATYEAIKGYIQTFISTVKPIIKTALGAIYQFWQSHGDQIMSVVKMAMDVIVGTIGTALDAILTAVRTGMAVIRGDWEQAWNLVAGFLERTLNGIINFAEKWGGRFLDWVGQLVNDVIQWFVDLARELVGASIIPDMFNSILQELTQFVSDFIADVASFTGDIISDIQSFATDTLNEFTTLFGDVGSELGSFVSDFTSDVASFTSDIVSDIQSFASDVLSDFTGLFNDVISEAQQWVSDLLSEVDSLISDVNSAVSSWSLGSVFDGPLSDAKSTVDSIMGDIHSIVSSTLSDVESLASDIVSTAESAYNDAQDALSDARSAASDAASAASSAASSAADAAGDAVSSGAEAATNVGEDLEEEIMGNASGGVVTDKSLSWLAEAGDSEAVIPLNKRGEQFMTGLMQESLENTALSDGGGGGGGTYNDINVTIDTTDDRVRRDARRGLKEALRSENFD